MKGGQDISPWKIAVERTDTKEHLQQYSRAVESIRRSLPVVEYLPQMEGKQEVVEREESGLGRVAEREGIKMARSTSLRNYHQNNYVHINQQMPLKIDQNCQFRSRFTLQPIKHYQKPTGNAKQLLSNPSTPFIKHRAQTILKNYQAANPPSKYPQIPREQSQRLKLQKIEAKTHNIEFTYSSPPKLRGLPLEKAGRQQRRHILDTLLSRWD